MEKKLGLSALTALVLSSMLGAGVFSLPQNMAAVAQPGSTAHRLGYYWRWHFIAGLCHADPHAHSPRT